MNYTVTLYLIGFAGTGKYTIAKEIAKHGYKIVDNHLINDPIFSLLNLDGATSIPGNAWNAIAEIRNAVLNFISQYPPSNYVFTNVLLEDEGDRAFYDSMLTKTDSRGAIFIPVKLHISSDEHEKRVRSPERKEKFKVTSRSADEIEIGLIHIDHPHLFELDVTHLSAEQAATEILNFIESIKK
ncbi:MAG: hypothetical protein H0X26_07920 [Alphaproteobacteria bacterium]|nr:hypothetical protein [Alphaproteobacteria bacterium]